MVGVSGCVVEVSQDGSLEPDTVVSSTEHGQLKRSSMNQVGLAACLLRCVFDPRERKARPLKP